MAEVEEEKEAIIPKQGHVCPKCDMLSSNKWNLKRHIRLLHSDYEPKYVKHIKKDKKVFCAVCNKEYAHSRDLKKHYIDTHQMKELKEKGVPLRALAQRPARYNTAPKV